MKLQILPVVLFFFASQVLAACGPNQVELWDLHGSTAQHHVPTTYRCYNAGAGEGGSGSCNGCTQQGGPNVRTLGASYCCDGPIQGLFNTCVTRCPPGFTTRLITLCHHIMRIFGIGSS
ncbi:hypothetical protein CSHISOI_08779 [Colletotrichum shisoi]|uniref:Uncharacterized protein n=1 Tax=Colletotrichum shisoi TaxID=2078593 RepID=A0A5Q4BIS4_9PEZI|nr:hypothetical protein CSHISOI_08779 [Colletotrichum shisoi]